jgi:hypothetical protein
MELRIQASMETVDFRRLVRDCAQEPQLVECFNRAFGANLQAPIQTLLDERRTLEASDEEQLMAGCFIVFVHEHIWMRLQRAQARARWP